MQVVILAAGRGTRMGELTKNTPKSLLQIAGQSILERKLNALPESIHEIVIVTGYLSEVIKKRFGEMYRGKAIIYVEQKNPVGGTMDALLSARTILHDSFLVMNGDDIHALEDVARCLKTDGKWVLAVSASNDLGSTSSVSINTDGSIRDIIEADVHGGGPGLAGVGMYVLDSRIFSVEPVRLPGRAEVGLPQTMLAASKALGIPVVAVHVASPIHLTTPEDIISAERILTGKKDA
jgi:NDP-sugar pyrophosphorylase family protein